MLTIALANNEGMGFHAEEQVFQGRHLHREVAVKVLQLDSGLVHAVQREVRLHSDVNRRALCHVQ